MERVSKLLDLGPEQGAICFKSGAYDSWLEATPAFF
jgi:hypothetical protein